MVNVYGVRFAGFCFGFVPQCLGLMLGGYSSASGVYDCIGYGLLCMGRGL